jgi:hemerythrin-like domain-containing protein
VLLDIRFLDDSTRPPVQKLDGLTPEQKAPGEHLKEIHNHLRDNMVTIGRLIDRALEGKITIEEVEAETADLAIVANYKRFGNLCGQHCQIVEMHHSIEDYAVFPKLATYGEPFRKIAERLKAEHVVVHELLERLMDALVALTETPTSENFATAREVYEALARVLLSHLGYEEDAMGDALGYFEIA